MELGPECYPHCLCVSFPPLFLLFLINESRLLIPTASVLLHVVGNMTALRPTLAILTGFYLQLYNNHIGRLQFEWFVSHAHSQANPCVQRIRVLWPRPSPLILSSLWPEQKPPAYKENGDVLTTKVYCQKIAVLKRPFSPS